MQRLRAPDQFQTGIPKAKAAKSSGAKPGLKSGYLGTKFDGQLGSVEGDAAEFLPVVTLDGVRPVSVQLHTEMGPPRSQIELVPQPDVAGDARQFSLTATPYPRATESTITRELMAAAGFDALSGGVAVDLVSGSTYTVLLHLSGGSGAGIVDRLANDDPLFVFSHIRLQWASTVRRLAITAHVLHGGGAVVDHVEITCDVVSEDGSDPFPATGEGLDVALEYTTEVLESGKVREQVSGATRTLSLSRHPLDEMTLGDFDAGDMGSAVRLRVSYPVYSIEVVYSVVSVTDDNDRELTNVVVDLTAVSTTGGAFPPGAPEDGDAFVVTPLTAAPDVELVPNAAARARVRFRTSQSGEQVFDCDWVGGFQVYAHEIEIERVSYRPNHELAYRAATVKLYAGLALDGDTPRLGPQYTEPVEAVAGAGGSREIPIPNFARRVSLLLKYGDVGSGDAPLAQLFVAFKLPHQGSLGFIDALSARAALFGDGIPIPHGAEAIVLTNASPTAVAAGAIFHLGL